MNTKFWISCEQTANKSWRSSVQMKKSGTSDKVINKIKMWKMSWTISEHVMNYSFISQKQVGLSFAASHEQIDE